MDRVADDLVDHAAVRDRDVGDALDARIEQGDELRRIGGVRHGGEALDVGEQGGQLAAFARSLIGRMIQAMLVSAKPSPERGEGR